MSDKLLPCPFCGERALFINRRGNKALPPVWGVVCDGDCGVFCPETDETQEEAATVWNRRSLTEVLPDDKKTL